MKFATLHLNELVLHQIPGHGSPVSAPVLSDVPSVMQAGQREYIQQRVRGALAAYARPIIEDSPSQAAPNAIRGILSDPNSLVSNSQVLAIQLHGAQPRISPGGIVVVGTAQGGGSSSVIVAKLEHELGVRAHQTQLPDGTRTFDVQLLTDLLFTEGSRVFKVALFEGASTPLVGHIVDNQAASYGVAQYFLSSFLGCGLMQRADRITEEFFSTAEDWLNRQADAAKRSRYALALQAEMQSPAPKVAPMTFVHQFIDADDQDELLAALTSSGVPTQPFEKDVTIISNRLSQVRIDTASGVIINAPSSAYDDGRVVIETDRDGVSSVVVHDEVRKVSGRGRRRPSSTGQGGD